MVEVEEKAPTERAALQHKSDDYLAWLGQFRPLTEIHFRDGSIAHVRFDRIDETIALHREEERGGRREPPLLTEPEPTGKVKRIYLWKDETPPVGATVSEGRTGGRYYEVVEGYRWHKGKQVPK